MIINLYFYNFQMNLEVVKVANNVEEINYITILITFIITLISIGCIRRLYFKNQGGNSSSPADLRKSVPADLPKYFCDACSVAMLVVKDKRAKRIFNDVIGRDRLKILNRRGLLGEIDEVEFQRLCAELGYFKDNKVAIYK